MLEVGFAKEVYTQIRTETRVVFVSEAVKLDVGEGTNVVGR